MLLRRHVEGLILGFVILACKRDTIDDAELGRRCALAEKSAADHDVEWRSAVERALATDLGPRPDLGRCPLAMPMLDFEMTFATAEATLARVGLEDVIRPSAIAVLTPEQLPTARSLTARQVLYDTRNLRAHTDGTNPRDGAYLLAEAQKLADPAFWKWDALVVVDRERAARDVDASGGTFVSGRTRGRVFVYDYASHRVACAADFEAKNSAEITVSAPSQADLGASAKTKLENDLLAQTVKAAFKDLSTAGPRQASQRDAGREGGRP